MFVTQIILSLFPVTLIILHVYTVIQFLYVQYTHHKGVNSFDICPLL